MKSHQERQPLRRYVVRDGELAQKNYRRCSCSKTSWEVDRSIQRLLQEIESERDHRPERPTNRCA